MSHANSTFERNLQKANVWLKDLSEVLQLDNPDTCYQVLRATLQTLRDRLTIEETAQLSAQLPLILRGAYFESWRPSDQPLKMKTKSDFLEVFLDRFNRNLDGKDPETLVRAAFEVIQRHISPGEVHDICSMLPKEIRALWPQVA